MPSYKVLKNYRDDVIDKDDVDEDESPQGPQRRRSMPFSTPDDDDAGKRTDEPVYYGLVPNSGCTAYAIVAGDTDDNINTLFGPGTIIVGSTEQPYGWGEANPSNEVRDRCMAKLKSLVDANEPYWRTRVEDRYRPRYGEAIAVGESRLIDDREVLYKAAMEQGNLDVSDANVFNTLYWVSTDPLFYFEYGKRADKLCPGATRVLCYRPDNKRKKRRQRDFKPAVVAPDEKPKEYVPTCSQVNNLWTLVWRALRTAFGLPFAEPRDVYARAVAAYRGYKLLYKTQRLHVLYATLNELNHLYTDNLHAPTRSTRTEWAMYAYVISKVKDHLPPIGGTVGEDKKDDDDDDDDVIVFSNEDDE